MKAGVVDNNYNLIARQEIVNEALSANYLCDKICEVANSFASTLCIEKKDILSIGVALPGVIDNERNVLLSACNLNIYNAPIKSMLQKRMDNKNIYIENDADAAALAELKFGAFKDKQNALLLTLGTGVGSGVIVAGKLFRGMELGHMPLFENGIKCNCGRIGCMETYCSANFLVAQGKRIAGDFQSGLIGKKAKTQTIDAKLVFDCAKENDPCAVGIVNDFVGYLSHAISVCYCFFQPQVVAIGGGVSHAGEFLFAQLREKTEKKLNCKIDIVSAMLKNDAGIIGATLLDMFGGK